MKSIQTINIPRRSNTEESGEGAIVIEHNNTFMPQELIDGIQTAGAPSQPVIVKGFDLYWILNTKEGTQFLWKLSNLDNVDFFMTEFIKTLIYFLWSHYKYRIIL